ncbi:MAG: hypothetical protein LYZ70_05930 [Nitrososphaerales archaeon]|nr:hypothetical protein [Nitrososphaerales archaeon]
MPLDVLRVAQGFVLVFGLVVIFYAARGYQRTKSKSMLLLGIGFAFVSVGAVMAGILFELLNVDLLTVQAGEAIAEAIGFFIIVYSLAVTKG